MRGETKPGLVALYDIRPGNGAGLFLQPGARTGQNRKSAVEVGCSSPAGIFPWKVSGLKQQVKVFFLFFMRLCDA